MILETFYTNGKNKFEGGKFDSKDWSAPYMVDKDEIVSTLNEFKLEGRKVGLIKVISMAYNLQRDYIEDYAYESLEDLSETERQEQSEYHNIDPELLYNRRVKIDGPLIICFDDNDHFEIDTPQDPEYRMSLNCIPWWVGPSVNHKNIKEEKIFSICEGKKITSVEVESYTTKEDPMLGGEFPDGVERELVSRIILWLEGKIGIGVEPWFDYCVVSIMNSNKDTIKIPFVELEQALFNWEDLHNDESVDFYSDCHTLWFGDKGKKMIGNPFITFSTEDEEHWLRIHEDDMDVINFAIATISGEFIDIYADDEREFSFEQWNEILDEMERIANHESFDDFFDYMLEAKTKTEGECDPLWYLNTRGEEFWNNRSLHQGEAKDLRKWSNLVRKPGEKMILYGF